MSEGEVIEPLPAVMLDAETDFRRRLAVKLVARGYSGSALADRIEELLRLEIPLRLRFDDVTDPPLS